MLDQKNTRTFRIWVLFYGGLAWEPDFFFRFSCLTFRQAWPQDGALHSAKPAFWEGMHHTTAFIALKQELQWLLNAQKAVHGQ